MGQLISHTASPATTAPATTAPAITAHFVSHPVAKVEAASISCLSDDVLIAVLSLLSLLER